MEYPGASLLPGSGTSDTRLMSLADNLHLGKSPDAFPFVSLDDDIPPKVKNSGLGVVM